MPDPDAKADELRAAVAGLEAQRSVLGDAVVTPAIAALKRQLKDLEAIPSSGVIEERKVVTILFVDVSGFTALSEKLDPEEVRNVINACFDRLVPFVQKYGGTIDKFIGDEIMALFGAPAAHENDPERALRSALEMMENISSFNNEHGTSLSLHIGVNTGPVVAGTVGSRDRKDYSVMGDAVNLAARLEDASPDGEIYVGPQTYRLTKSLFEFEPLPPLALKGKGEPLLAYRLVGLRTIPKSIRGIEGLHSELIGRNRELQRICDAVRAVQSGKGGIIAVVGEAGVGKSRLIAEALADLAGDPGWAEGRALSHTAGMSYWLARDILRALLHCTENTPVRELNHALRGSLQSVTPATFGEMYPYLAALLQLPLEGAAQERIRFLSGEALHGRILQAFRDYVSARASLKPLIVFGEDLHWCDPSSLLALESLLLLPTRVPLLLIVAYRPEETTMETLQREAQTLGGERFHLIELSPLTRGQSESLVERLLQIEALRPELRDLILDRAEGNPFFIEEMLRSLLDCGAVASRDGRITALPDFSQIRIPETVEGVLAARMDRLAPDHKAALQTASVIGRTFQRRVLEYVVAPNLRPTLDESLSELQDRDFIRSAQNGAAANGEYMFKHAITQDVAYQTLLKANRKEIHQKAGETFEKLFSDRRAEFSPTLAYHFERADAPEKAFRYLQQAGENAQAVFANTEAVAFYRSAMRQAGLVLEKNEESETRRALAHILESLGDVLQLIGENEEARANYNQSRTLVPGADRVGRSRLQRKIGSTYTVQRRYSSMTEAFDAADRELGNSVIEPNDAWWNEKMQILLERMHLFYWQGMSGEMIDLAKRHRNDVEQMGSPIQRGKFFELLALSDLTRNRYAPSEEGVRLAELAVSTSQESTDLSESARVRFGAGLIYLFGGNLPKAIAYCQLALSLSQRVGDLILQARCLTYLAVAHRRSGEMTETKAFADRTLALAAQLGMVEYVAMAKANLAWVAWRQENLDDVDLLGREALRLWHEMDDPYGVDWLALLPLIAVAKARNDFIGAVEYARALFSETQHPLPTALDTAARAAMATSDQLGPNGAGPKLEQLISVAKEIGYL